MLKLFHKLSIKREKLPNAALPVICERWFRQTLIVCRELWTFIHSGNVWKSPNIQGIPSSATWRHITSSSTFSADNGGWEGEEVAESSLSNVDGRSFSFQGSCISLLERSLNFFIIKQWVQCKSSWKVCFFPAKRCLLTYLIFPSCFRESWPPHNTLVAPLWLNAALYYNSRILVLVNPPTKLLVKVERRNLVAFFMFLTFGRKFFWFEKIKQNFVKSVECFFNTCCLPKKKLTTWSPLIVTT